MAVDTPAAAELVSRLEPPEISELVTTQLSLPSYLAPPQPAQRGGDRTHTRNEDLWSDILESNARAASVLTLHGFLLSDWFPFAAGAFHTPYGRREREHAQDAILYDGTSGAQPTRELLAAVPAVDPRSLGATKIYSSMGKGGMIAGGIGSIRLKPRRIDVGEVWLMSASSTPVPHEGFPIALPTEIYKQHADELHEKGAVRCTLTGELRFVENEMRARYGRGVPQLYLLVSELRREQAPAPAPARVSIPISFQSPDGFVHAAFANFRPGERGSLERATRWLEDTYVRRIYNGRVVTDFDERVRWFDDADFSLEKVMAGSLEPQQAGAVAERLQLGRHMTTVIIERVQLNGTLTAERIDTVHQDRVIQIGEGLRSTPRSRSPIRSRTASTRSVNPLRTTSSSACSRTLLARWRSRRDLPRPSRPRPWRAISRRSRPRPRKQNRVESGTRLASRACARPPKPSGRSASRSSTSPRRSRRCFRDRGHVTTPGRIRTCDRRIRSPSLHHADLTVARYSACRRMDTTAVSRRRLTAARPRAPQESNEEPRPGG